MQVANEPKAPSARVLLLRLVPGNRANPTQAATTLTHLILAAGGASGWTPVNVATAPAVDTLELNTAIHEQEALALLDKAESARASLFRGADDRESYIFAHAVLRLLIGHRLATDPAHVRFATGRFGKPRLAELGAPVHFSLSRRPGVVALALGSAPLGVDVEVIRGGIDISGISQRFFGEAEQAFLDGDAGEGGRVSRFFSLWSRKEALVKAAGVGIDALALAGALKSQTVLADEQGDRRTYCLHQLPSAADLVLAMAIESPGFPA